MTGWVAFGLTDEAAEQYRVLVDGVPQRLREPLISWLAHPLSTESRAYSARTREIEMLTDVRMGLQGEKYVHWSDYTDVLRRMEPDDLLKVVDATLSMEWYGTRPEALDDALTRGRSKWMVGTRMGKPGLVAREPEGVQDIVEATIADSGTAGQMLARAWGKVQALTPDDPGAYADAVRAVEIAAQPVVESTNREATLGSIASVMRNQGDWRLPLREHQHAPSAETLVAMLRTLYRGHADRHGNDDYRDVSHEEAHAGVVLAATLVSWFSAGAIQQRPANV